MNFIKLGDSSHDFLQVLIPEFILSRKERGIQLDISLSDDMDTLRNSEVKIEVNEKFQTNVATFRKNIDNFFENEDILSYRVRCPQFPLRYANGGVLPIIRLNNKEYFCFFYRCVFPVGWNIANGASNTQDDLNYPSKIIHREFLEELFFFDNVNKIHYCLDTNPNQYSTGTFTEALKLWQNTLLDDDLEAYIKQPLPIKWISGPDKITIKRDSKAFNSSEIFINITPQDNAIEIDRMAIINLKDDIIIADGEVEEILLNRIIGLFSVEKVLNTLHENSFTPDRIFYGGKEHSPEEMNRLLVEDYFPRHKKANIRTAKQDSYFSSLEKKKDLCPITRSLVVKYNSWKNLVDESIKESPIPEKDRTKYLSAKVFISYKSEDTDIAFWLYDFLESRNIPSFCSGKSIPSMGESDYAKLIDKALEKCSYLVVVGTRPEYFDTGWVRYEWSSFLNETRSDRKPLGKVFTLTSEIPISSLPYALRSVQNLPFSKNVLYESFSNLLMYIDRNDLNQSQTV